MKESYLVQRLEKPFLGEVKSPIQALAKYGLSATGFSKEAQEAISNFCVFDYMGSSEYEFGAIPKAFRQMFEDKNLGIYELNDVFYSYKSWKMENAITGTRSIYIICNKENSEEVISRIRKFAIGDPLMRTKEMTEFNNSLAEHEWGKDTVGWMDLENGFMWFKDKEMYENFAKLFGILK